MILGAMLIYRFGFPNGIDLIHMAAFLFGWMIFQATFFAEFGRLGLAFLKNSHQQAGE